MCKCEGEDHPTYGACLRSKNLRIGYAASAKGLDKTDQDRLDKDLALYREAREGGLQPNSTKRADVIATMEAAS